MGKDPVGYRFAPTGEELIIYYLMNKILGNICLVDEAISEINLCSYEPKFLPLLAKIQSDDLVWYFFCPIEYATAKNKATKRSTGSGFWKPTGIDRKIRDKRGKGVEIGLKKTLVYHQGKVPNEVRTPWVIHEFHITCLPQNQRNYVICQVMYKGEQGDILYGINSNEPSHSLASVSNTFRAINTAPEVSPGEGNIFGMSADDLVIPVNPNTFFNINPNVQTQTFRAINTAPELQVEQLGDENVFGMSMDDLVNPVTVNEQRSLSLSDGFNPNTLLNDDNNINPNGGSFEDAFITGLNQLEVEENCNGLSENDLLMPMNQHNDLAGFYPNTLLFGGDYNNNHQPQTCDDDFLDDFLNDGVNYELMMQENRNEHRPKKALSGYFVDSSGDSGSGSDAESISATSYKGTSSSGSNVASPIPSCSSTDSCKDLQTCADSSVSKQTKGSQLTSKQEVKQGTPGAVDASIDKNESSLVKTEKKGLFILEDSNRQTIPRYIYFINMIIGFLLLLLALIANIVSVY